MSATQPNAETFNPNQLNLVQVATYGRRIQAPIARVWENVLDWEHLPHLHDSSFDHIELDSVGSWGWRTFSNPARTDHIELTIASTDSYVARSYASGQQISEIWTTITPVDNDVQVEVNFYLPDIPEESVDQLGRSMVKLYTRLWDEDERMMQTREQRLNESRDDAREKQLGQLDEIRDQLANGQALVFELARREFRLHLVNNRLVAQPTICPHLPGPLEQFDPETMTVGCPWHGYRFDLTTGRCIRPETATCRLGALPDIRVQDTRVIARLARHAGTA